MQRKREGSQEEEIPPEGGKTPETETWEGKPHPGKVALCQNLCEKEKWKELIGGIKKF